MSNFLKYRIGFVLLFITLYSFIDTNAFAQKTRVEYKKNGDLYFDKGDYVEASANYLKLLSFDSNDIAIAYKYALSEYNQRNFYVSKQWLEKVITKDFLHQHNEAFFYLALSEKSLENYEDAIRYLLQLTDLSLTYTLPQFIETQLAFELSSLQYAIDNKDKKRQIQIYHLEAPINSPYSEFNPIPLGTSSLYFSRYKPIFDNDTIESMFAQVYTTEIVLSTEDKLGWGSAVSVGSKVNNPKYHNANLSFNHNKSKAYFSRCIDLDGKVGNCKIFAADIEQGKWKNVKALNNEINVDNCTNTQPFFVEMPNYKALYFVSNREGGYGGLDIWYSIFINGDFQQAINLGSAINTSLDELCPTYSVENQRLYFSSNGHHGFGGFDIFKSNGGLNEWPVVENMKMPINSAANDLYYYPVKKNNQAYFVSNRAGSFHLNNAEFCCTDIYRVEFNQDTLEAPLQIPNPVHEDSTAQKIQDLLPISLYFHNDEPNPKSLAVTTDRNYQALLSEYVSLKSRYMFEYSQGLSGKQADKAKADIESFFADSVESGFANLEKLSELLKTELLAGKSVNIKVKGYASPLNTPAYNLNLSKRRIASLRNYLMAYQSGFFMDYFEGKSANGAKLNVYEDAFGDSKSRNSVSDNSNDQRNSIYSRAAAEQRKIQIIRFSSFSDSLQVNDNFGLPILDFLNQSLYFEGLSSKQNFTKVLSIKNSGQAVLNIQSISSSSEKLKIELPQNSLQPNEQTDLFLLFKSSQLTAGKYEVMLEIISNQSQVKQEITMLFIVE